MRKPLTGEPCAGESHARFRGREPFSTPIRDAQEPMTEVRAASDYRARPFLPFVVTNLTQSPWFLKLPNDFQPPCLH